MQNKTKISLVLGCGAARGLAHIGAIKCLEDNDYEIQYISGSSMGALIGGIFAAGQLDVYVDWVKELKRRNIIRLLDISFSRKSLFKGEKIIQALNEIIKDCLIEELPIGYTAVATDIIDQKEVWFTQGSLFDAIRASIAVPMIFSPVQYQERILVDGGIINPIPIAPTLNDDTEITVAVGLNGPPEIIELNQMQPQHADRSQARNKYQFGIEKFIEGLLPKGTTEKSKDDLGLFNLVTQSMDTMQSSIARFKLAANRPDIVIEIPRNICSWFEFDRAAELIEFGYKRTEDSLNHYEKLLERRE